MSWRDMTGQQDQANEMTAQIGGVKGQMYAGIGQSLAGGISKGFDTRKADSVRKEGFAHDDQMQRTGINARAAESETQFNRQQDVNSGNARAFEETVNALRGGGPLTAGAATQGQSDLDSSIDSMTGGGGPSPGPTSPAQRKMSGFTDVAAAETAYRMIQEDQARRRAWGQQDESLDAATRTFGAQRLGSPNDPNAMADPRDLALSARGGFADDVSRNAQAIRQGSYLDPMAQEDRSRAMSREDTTNAQADQMFGANLAGTQARTQESLAQTLNYLRQASMPTTQKPLTGSEVNQLLASSTGRQHEELRALLKQREEVQKTLMNPYGVDPGSRQAAEQEKARLDARMNEIKAEIDGIHQQWFKTLGQGYPGADIPNIAGGQLGGLNFDTSAIDKVLAGRGVQVPAAGADGR